jgi:hypothetical protein
MLTVKLPHTVYKETVAGNHINDKQTSKSNKIFETVLKHDPKNDNTAPVRRTPPNKLLSRVKPTTPARRRIHHKGTEALAHCRSGRQTYIQKSVSSTPHHTHTVLLNF